MRRLEKSISGWDIALKAKGMNLKIAKTAGGAELSY